jgi:hypothetical protein
VKSKLIQKRKLEKTHVVSVSVLHATENVRFELSDDDALLFGCYIIYGLQKYLVNMDDRVPQRRFQTFCMTLQPYISTESVEIWPSMQLSRSVFCSVMPNSSSFWTT